MAPTENMLAECNILKERTSSVNSYQNLPKVKDKKKRRSPKKSPNTKDRKKGIKTQQGQLLKN